jgi:hypothetical protein
MANSNFEVISLSTFLPNIPKIQFQDDFLVQLLDKNNALA